MDLAANYEDLAFFQHHSEDVLRDFVGIAWEVLMNKSKPKLYTHAALKLNTEHVTIEKLVGKISQLLLECTKLKITMSEFVDSLQPILHDKVFLLWDSVVMKKDTLSEILVKTEINHVEFLTLNWRFENTLASKTLETYENTTVFMELQLKDRYSKKHHHFVADIPNLFHLTNLLEVALNETKASHIRRASAMI
ncbi:COMM domain-containing protein 2 [Daphnia magna]|uniref:Uncharacterized protein n=2 Tax=Daphnia magna TaxID=35525 RepID=A0ABQ9ZWH1_9CRUS|nr:COMM domain-containing protein 2 [Daphnia magna]KAK4017265.1 hypothetical protein OUZ56_032212 [Daphnia magna]KZS06642.1 COMM domain-containing protein 2 [Daphnia magna]